MDAIQQYYSMAVRKECDEDHASLLKTMTLRMSCNHISFANHSHTMCMQFLHAHMLFIEKASR